MRRGFTMVELLVVILIIAILIALLVPAIAGAVRAARNAQVGAEINTMVASLNQFKTAYGDFPPSRMYLNEAGFYPVNEGAPIATLTGVGTDISVGQLAQRSLRYLQKFWPRASFSSTTALYPTAAPNSVWHDFNGNANCDINPVAPNVLHGGYIIQGHQCLVFFLGGIPYNPGSGIGMSGFGKNPVNPFTNMFVGNSMYRGGISSQAPSSTQPFFEFKGSRLVYDPNDPYQMPGYVDPIGSNPPTFGTSVNFYAYFSSYGNAYDPNDVNFAEMDSVTGTPIGLNVNLGFPTFSSSSAASITCTSPVPNPYTASVALPPSGTAVFQSPNTFQIISSGADGHYGPGGQYTGQGGNTLPFELNADLPAADTGVRSTENDNLSNFANSKLGG